MSPALFFLAASSSFLAGLALRLFLPVSYTGIAIAVGAVIVGGVLISVSRFALTMLVTMTGFLLGVFHAGAALDFWNETPSFALEQARVRVIGYPEEKSFYQEVRLRVLSCGDTACPPESAGKDILWQAPVGETRTTGEEFFFSCSLSPVENFQADFDYRLFLAKEGVGSLCKQKQGSLAGSGEVLAPTGVAGLLGQSLYRAPARVEAIIGRVFPEPEAGLAKGLLLGGGDFLGESLETDFQRIGMTHIVAVSGYNILLVAGLFLYAGNSLGLWRRQTLLLALFGIALFVCLVGAPASALRAGIMAAVAFLALATGRMGSWFTAILLALLVMLAANPLLLRYDVGFQLSFLAVLGIVASAWEHEWGFLEKGTWRAVLFQAVKTTIWVELFVLPLILYHFGTVAWFSLIANVVLLPLIPLAMLASFAAVLFGLVLPASLAALLSVPDYAILLALTRFAEFFGALPSIAWEGLTIHPAALALWYALLISFCVWRYLRHKRAWYAQAFLSAS